MTTQKYEVGATVGAGRWPYTHAHPDCWLEPLQGTVLRVDSPSAWRGTFAFPGKDLPSQQEVTHHVLTCQSQGLLLSEVPVTWETDKGPKVYWEHVDSLRSYAQDYAEWTRERAEARKVRAA